MSLKWRKDECDWMLDDGNRHIGLVCERSLRVVADGEVLFFFDATTIPEKKMALMTWARIRKKTARYEAKLWKEHERGDKR